MDEDFHERLAAAAGNVALVEELSDLGHDLRAALLRANLRRHLDRS